MKNYIKYSNIIILFLWVIARLLTSSYYSQDLHYGWTEKVSIFNMLHNLKYIDSKGLQEEFVIGFFIFLVIFIANILFIFTALYRYYFAFIVIQLTLIIYYANIKILFFFYAGIFSLHGLLTADGEWFAEGWPNLHVLGLYHINIVITILLFLYKYWTNHRLHTEAETARLR